MTVKELIAVLGALTPEYRVNGKVWVSRANADPEQPDFLVSTLDIQAEGKGPHPY
jgi:hypothetical protein